MVQVLLPWYARVRLGSEFISREPGQQLMPSAVFFDLAYEQLKADYTATPHGLCSSSMNNAWRTLALGSEDVRGVERSPGGRDKSMLENVVKGLLVKCVLEEKQHEGPREVLLHLFKARPKEVMLVLRSFSASSECYDEVMHHLHRYRAQPQSPPAKRPNVEGKIDTPLSARGPKPPVMGKKRSSTISGPVERDMGLQSGGEVRPEADNSGAEAQAAAHSFSKWNEIMFAIVAVFLHENYAACAEHVPWYLHRCLLLCERHPEVCISFLQVVVETLVARTYTEDLLVGVPAPAPQVDTMLPESESNSKLAAKLAAKEEMRKKLRELKGIRARRSTGEMERTVKVLEAQAKAEANRERCTLERALRVLRKVWEIRPFEIEY